MQDNETVAVYDEKADEYAQMVLQEGVDPALVAFMKRLPVSAFVLDLGCGPGNSASELTRNGFEVDAVDASAAMVKLANEAFSVDARQATFEEINADAIYDAVWANFSLLHAPKDKFSGHLQRLHRALKPNGFLHLGMKLGAGERRDRLGRHYSFFSEEDLQGHLRRTDFAIIETKRGEAEGLADGVEPWITILSRRS